MRRLTKASIGASIEDIQKAEIEGIRDLTGRNILRLKVGGDTANQAYAEGLRDACEAHTRKHGRPAYGYCHVNWKSIPRASFGGISILASCDTIAEISEAKARGYATATVVSEFPNGSKVFELGGNKIVPCPEQIADMEIAAGVRPKDKAIQCVDCQLCCKDQMLIEKGLTVGFKAHGRKAPELIQILKAKGA